CANPAALGNLRTAWPAGGRPAKIHRLGRKHDRREHHDWFRVENASRRNSDQALSGGAFGKGPRHGGEGLIGELIRVEKNGSRLSRDEMVSMVFVLLFAGHETTTHLISGSVLELLKNRELRDWLAEDWKRTDLAVEEFLRFI